MGHGREVALGQSKGRKTREGGPANQQKNSARTCEKKGVQKFLNQIEFKEDQHSKRKKPSPRGETKANQLKQHGGGSRGFTVYHTDPLTKFAIQKARRETQGRFWKKKRTSVPQMQGLKKKKLSAKNDSVEVTQGGGVIQGYLWGKRQSRGDDELYKDK